MNTLKYHVVERLADLMLGCKLPIPMEPGVPANKKVTKTMLGRFYDGYVAGKWDIDPSPIRNRVIETIEREIERRTTPPASY